MRDDDLPVETVGLRLARITRREKLILCEPVRFIKGRSAAALTLRRAALSGRVEVNGEIHNHFADVLDDNEDILCTVALDADSYRILKNRWMRCRVEQ